MARDTSERSGKDEALPPAGPKRRLGKAATTTKILDAAEQLFSSRDPNMVTVRQIAELAGVNHSLVHQYVGAKSEILNAVIQRTATDRRRTISEHPSLREVMPLLFDDVFVRKMQTLAVVRSAMDGVEYTSLRERITTGELLVELAQESVAAGLARAAAPPVIDARIALAAFTALTYGWVALEPWLLQAFDLAGEDPADLRARVSEIATSLTELILPLSGPSAVPSAQHE